jgi:hypothetical protein
MRFIMPGSNPQPVEETNIFDILETLLRGWKRIAVFLAGGLAVAWLWFSGGPAPGVLRPTLEVVWSPGYVPSSFTVQVPSGFGRTGASDESVKISAMWSPANALSPPHPLPTLWASFQAGPLGSSQKTLALKSLRQESAEPGRLIWACQTADRAAGLEALEALNDLADLFEEYLLAELTRPNNALRARYETALAATEKASAGQEAALAALRAGSLKESAGGQGDKQPSSGEAEERPGLTAYRNQEDDLLMDIAFQEAQKARLRFLLNQIATAEIWPLLRRTSSLVVPPPESRRPILVKSAGLVFLALVLGAWSVFAAEGWRRHRAKRRASADAGGLKS